MGPWGYAAIAAVLAVTTEAGRSALKTVLKTGVKVGLDVQDSLGEMVNKANEYKDDLIAEIKADELDTEKKPARKKKAVAAE